MSIYSYDFVTPTEAREVLDYTITGGDSLLRYGVEDFGQIMSWINLADLALEIVPSCRASLNVCLDWYATNRERVEVTLTVLRDARDKAHSPLYADFLNPSQAYRMLMERACDGE